ncbi:SCO family protein [Rhodococcus pseudokoreensis]|uniref:SCO family protein n=1 Tax=Rhodococcus pseudokoreensis TaxID=2811421 RepID=A0A974W3Z7_9NOCA|nr:SCO family protein [Rhodococcus pseudokoreensis]QSE90631.1 SCO family protein [Rhodococcus pseudokoreensis]
MPETTGNVAGRYVGGAFDLVDHDGREVTDRTYHGKYAVVFFGFTHCKMVCPRALHRLSTVLDRLGPLADRTQPLYVTVDPERDSPEVMKEFLAADYPRFTGLTGTPAQVEKAKKSFRVYSTTVADPDDPDSYQMPHSAFTYVLGPDGNYRTHFTDAVDEDELVTRLSSILR